MFIWLHVGIALTCKSHSTHKNVFILRRKILTLFERFDFHQKSLYRYICSRMQKKWFCTMKMFVAFQKLKTKKMPGCTWNETTKYQDSKLLVVLPQIQLRNDARYASCNFPGLNVCTGMSVVCKWRVNLIPCSCLEEVRKCVRVWVTRDTVRCDQRQRGYMSKKQVKLTLFSRRRGTTAAQAMTYWNNTVVGSRKEGMFEGTGR